MSLISFSYFFSWVLLSVLFNEGVEETEEAEDEQTLRLLVRDNDSCTLVLGPDQLQFIQSKGFSDLLEVAPTLWRVIDIHLAQVCLSPSFLSFSPHFRFFSIFFMSSC